MLAPGVWLVGASCFWRPSIRATSSMAAGAFRGHFDHGVHTYGATSTEVACSWVLGGSCRFRRRSFGATSTVAAGAAPGHLDHGARTYGATIAQANRPDSIVCPTDQLDAVKLHACRGRGFAVERWNVFGFFVPRLRGAERQVVVAAGSLMLHHSPRSRWVMQSFGHGRMASGRKKRRQEGRKKGRRIL